jgi:hypothetical protein
MYVVVVVISPVDVPVASWPITEAGSCLSMMGGQKSTRIMGEVDSILMKRRNEEKNSSVGIPRDSMYLLLSVSEEFQENPAQRIDDDDFTHIPL